MLLNMKCVIVVILLSLYVQNILSNPIITALTVAKTVIAAIKAITSTIKMLQPKDQTPQLILNVVTDISTRFNEIGMNLNQKIDDLSSSIPQTIHDIIRVENDVKDMEENIRDINNMYRMIFVDLKNETFSNFTLQSFILAATTVNHDNPINKVENIHSLFFPHELKFIKTSWLNIYLSQRKACDELYSSHLWLNELFSLLAKIEVKALAMVITAYKLRSASTLENYDNDINRTQSRFSNRMNDYLILMRESIRSSPTEIFRCDAKSPTRGKTFIELEKFSQKFIVNTDQLDSREGCDSCEKVTEFHGPILNYKNRQTYPIEGTCNGKIVGCKTWSNQKYYRRTQIEVCVLPTSSSRRYQWFKDTDNHYYGPNINTCPGNIVSDEAYHKRNSHPSIGFISLGLNDIYQYNCNYCICTCIEENNHSTAVRKFNPYVQRSNINAKMVVIGVRLVQDKDGVISIQIKEGKLISEGKILPGSERWVPIEKPKDSGRFITIDHRIKYINLEDLHPPLDFHFALITGVGFQNYWRINLLQTGSDGAIGIRLEITEFDFNSLRVLTFAQSIYSRYMGNIYAFQDSPSDMDLGRAKNPLESYSNSLDSLENGQWVEIQPSDFESDAGQTVVPFLDIQPVYTDPAFPLSGMGLIHRGAPDYGGYVALKIITLNLTDFIN